MKNNIPPSDIISYVQSEAEGLNFGTIRLEIFLRDGKPRWQISKSQSIVDASTIKGVDVYCQKTVEVVA